MMKIIHIIKATNPHKATNLFTKKISKTRIPMVIFQLAKSSIPHCFGVFVVLSSRTICWNCLRGVLFRRGIGGGNSRRLGHDGGRTAQNPAGNWGAENAKEKFFRLPFLKLTWPLKMGAPWKRRFLLESIIFRGYVCLRESTLPPITHGSGKWVHLHFFCVSFHSG